MNVTFQWFQAHPLWASLAGLILTALVNALLGYLTSAKWVGLVQSNPRVAAFLLLLKHAGFNPQGVIKAIVSIFSGKVGIKVQLPDDEKKDPQ